MDANVDRAETMSPAAGVSWPWAWPQVRTRGHPDVRIAVLDGPVDRDHASLAAARLTVLPFAGLPFAGPPHAGQPTASRARAAAAHGTFIASVIFGQGDGPVRGVAPGCRGLIVPIFGDGRAGAPSGIAGHPTCSELDLARAITQAALAGAHVINISAGVPVPRGDAHRLLRRAVHWCERNGVLVVAAVGNAGGTTVDVPAALPWVLAVGATDHQGHPLALNNWDADASGHGLLAPGADVWGATPGGGATRGSGSSVAAAIVSGVAALLLSELRRHGHRPDPSRVRAALLHGARRREETGGAAERRRFGGVLDVDGAMAWLGLADRARHPDHSESLLTEGETLMCHSTSPPDIAANIAADTRDDRVSPSQYSRDEQRPCRCQSAAADHETPQPQPLVYALGTIGYDLRSEARRDAFVQRGVTHPHDPAEMLGHLAATPASADALTWTLNQEETPLYAIRPAGAFAAETYARLRDCLQSQIASGADHVSIAGVMDGHTRLLNGQVVPVVTPDLRGLYCWTVPALVAAVAGTPPGETAVEPSYRARVDDVSNFLERIYSEVRNLGLAPQDRAINFAATNAFQVEHVFRSALEAGLKLDAIDVDRSPICRPESDCWDVKLTFFHPARRLEQARLVYRFTVDVSDVVPVSVGRIRAFHVY
jgi:hypothetical protein